MQQAAMAPFAAVLRGEAVPWAAFGLTGTGFLETCRAEALAGLVHHRVHQSDAGRDWPERVRAALGDEARRGEAVSLLRDGELNTVLRALASAGVRPLILKGAALAHTHYPAPASRPRIDTDILIPSRSVGATRQVLLDCGYTAPNFCGGDLFCQFPMQKSYRFGFVHKLDVHWKISTQPVFADVLSYPEMAAASIEVPALGPHARAPHSVHGLLLACVHPAMHHRNVESLLWQFDIHLLAASLSDMELGEFAELARRRRVSTICAEQLDATRRRFGTSIPEAVRVSLAGGGDEPSAAYLRANRQWTDDLVASLRGLRRWPERVRFLRDVAFPSPRYMRSAYDLPRSPLATLMLPLVYAHRLAAGGWKILAGQK
jgi:hypothetical protein